jgi:TPR repeat protein
MIHILLLLFIFTGLVTANECDLLLEKRTVVSKSNNPVKIINLETKICELDCLTGFSCINLSNIYEQGIIVKKDLKKSKQIYIDSCNKHKESIPCMYAQLKFKEEKNHPKYIEYADKACQYGNLPSCVDLGGHYVSGDISKVDYIKSKELFSKVLSTPTAGKELVGDAQSGMAYMYANGLGFRQDFYEAKKLNELACENNSSNGCMNLALHYYNGKGTRQDYVLAKESFGKACDLGIQKGCDMYKELNQ